jgi:excisionase family DNA binding protein
MGTNAPHHVPLICAQGAGGAIFAQIEDGGAPLLPFASGHAFLFQSPPVREMFCHPPRDLETTVSTTTDLPLNKAFLDVDDLAEMLGVSNKTLRSWVQTQRFPAPIIFSRSVWRWRRETVEAWLRQKEGNVAL